MVREVDLAEYLLGASCHGVHGAFQLRTYTQNMRVRHVSQSSYKRIHRAGRCDAALREAWKVRRSSTPSAPGPGVLPGNDRT